MTNPVFLAEAAEISAAVIGETVQLTGPEGHHAAVVQRKQIGDLLDLVDGKSGLRLTCVVREINREVVHLEVLDRTVEPSSNPRLILIQALAKGDRSEQAIEFATELGVDEVIPWQAARSIVQWRGEKQSRGVAKWRNIVHSAAKQARRSQVPAVGELIVTGRSGGLVALVESVVVTGGMVLVLHEDADLALTSLDLSSIEHGAPGHGIWLVVGPEGGISDEERAQLQSSGAKEVRLGATVLRSSSAGPAALVALLVRLGRW